MLRASNMLRRMLRNNVSGVVGRGLERVETQKNPGNPGLMSFENAPARGRNFIQNPVVSGYKRGDVLRLMLR